MEHKNWKEQPAEEHHCKNMLARTIHSSATRGNDPTGRYDLSHAISGSEVRCTVSHAAPNICGGSKSAIASVSSKAQIICNCKKGHSQRAVKPVSLNDIFHGWGEEEEYFDPTRYSHSILKQKTTKNSGITTREERNTVNRTVFSLCCNGSPHNHTYPQLTYSLKAYWSHISSYIAHTSSTLRYCVQLWGSHR